LPITDFILGLGDAGAEVLIRAIGLSLTQFGFTDALADPMLESHNTNGDLAGSNDNWKPIQPAEIEATGLAPHDDAESAILQNLAPAAYTAIVWGKNHSTGVALVEIYNLGPGTVATSQAVREQAK